MRVEKHVRGHDGREPLEGVHVLVVLAVVEAVEQSSEVGDIREHRQDLRRVEHLLAESDAVERDDGGEHGVEDERLVAEELGGGEGGERVQEELGSLLEVAGRDGVERLIHLGEKCIDTAGWVSTQAAAR